MVYSSKVTDIHGVTPAEPAGIRQRRSDLSGLGREEVDFIEQTFDGFRRRRNSRGQRAKYDEEVIATVRDFFSYTGLGPWNWTEQSFDEWNEYLVRDRKAKVTTQSTYQNHF